MATEEAIPAGESDAQRQARLRRERRNAKLKAGGSERLNKITSLSGRPAAAEAELSRTPSPSSRPEPTNVAPQNSTRRSHAASDPDEVDISQMFARQPNDDLPDDPQAMFRQMLAASGPQPQDGGTANAQSNADDPMAQMMEMLMSGGGGGGDGQLPAGLASMFGGGGQQQQPEARRDTHIWRIVHALTALAIGLYAAADASFTGTAYHRHAYNSSANKALPSIFYMFVSTELILQTSRYFMDRGKLPAGGILSTIGNFLPPPYGGYARLLSRYSTIWTTMVSDAMVIVFILGVRAWWHGPLDSPVPST